MPRAVDWAPGPFLGDPIARANYLYYRDVPADQIKERLVNEYPGEVSPQRAGQLAQMAARWSGERAAFVFATGATKLDRASIPRNPAQAAAYVYHVNLILQDQSGREIYRYVQIESATNLSAREFRARADALVRSYYAPRRRRSPGGDLPRTDQGNPRTWTVRGVEVVSATRRT
jgi:hypothetical protein